MPQVFHVVRCCDCETFQVQQVKKVMKWSCKVCGQKQSLIKEYGRGSAADCRHHVQKLNSLRQEMDRKEFDKNLTVLYHQPEQQQQENGEEDSTCNRWQKFLNSNPDTESVNEDLEEENATLSTADQFEVENFQNLRKRPKWSVSQSNHYRKTLSKHCPPDAFDDDDDHRCHIQAPKRTFLNAEQPCPPSQNNTTGQWKMTKYCNAQGTPFSDGGDFTKNQFGSNSGHPPENVFKPASHVAASNSITSTTTTTTTRAIKQNEVMYPYSKRSSLLDHSPSKASSNLSFFHQKSQTGSFKDLHSTSSSSSKWSNFLSNPCKMEDSVDDSDNDDDDDDDGDNDSDDGLENGGAGSDGGGRGVGANNTGSVTQSRPYNRSQHETPTNRNSLFSAKKTEEKGHRQEFSGFPLTSVCQNSTVTSATVIPKDFTGVRNMFNLDENEFDFTF